MNLIKLDYLKHKYFLLLNYQNLKYFLRFPNLVFKLITLFSLKESIGGICNLTKILSKKMIQEVYIYQIILQEGVSSPIEPTASLASSAIGWRIISRSSILIPNACCLFL